MNEHFLINKLSSLFKILYLYLVWNIARGMRKFLENNKWNWDRGNGKDIQIKFTGYLTCAWHWVTIVNCIICPQFCYSLHSSPLFCDFATFSYQKLGIFPSSYECSACHMACLNYSDTSRCDVNGCLYDLYMKWARYMHVCHCCQIMLVVAIV